jgi:hypothetical protein
MARCCRTGLPKCLYIATGKADKLVSLYISENDNITELVARSDEIKKNAWAWINGLAITPFLLEFSSFAVVILGLPSNQTLYVRRCSQWVMQGVSHTGLLLRLLAQ